MKSLVEQAWRMATDWGPSAYNTMERFGHYMQRGALHNIGAEPVRATQTAFGQGMEMNLFGRAMSTIPGAPMAKIGGMTQPMTWGSAGWAGVNLFGGVVSAGMGYAEAGIPGALRNIVTDIGVDAAMVSQGYKANAIGAGVSTFSRKGFMNVLGRYAVGSTLAYGVSNALGGGMVGTAGALMGGSLGVRHAGKLAAIGGAYYMTKAAAHGTYQILKAGNSHFQAQKQIQTDGDMSAFMTQGAFSMRSRAVQAIQRSHSNARSALGKEASYMSMPMRSYTSPYRQF